MFRFLTLSSLVFTSAYALNTEQLSAADLRRAKLPVPPKGSRALASSPEAVPSTLNELIKKSLPAEKLKPCEDFADEAELNHVIQVVNAQSNQGLQEIYERTCSSKKGCDNRNKRHLVAEGFVDEWNDQASTLQLVADPEVRKLIKEVTRNGKCYEAQMLFFHHTSEQGRQEILKTDMVLPLLPESWESYDQLVNLQYEDSTQQRSPSLNSLDSAMVADTIDLHSDQATCGSCHLG